MLFNRRLFIAHCENTLLKLIEKVKEMAINSFLFLKGRDFGRIEIKTNKIGKCFFMEANLVPGMTENTSYFPMAFKIDLGLNYDDVINLIIQQGLNRITPLTVMNTFPKENYA